MGWSFRRRIKVIPGVYLNLSKRGVSTTLGVRGASLTFRNDGTYANIGIPGTGIYNRQKISGSSKLDKAVPTANPTINNSVFNADYEYVSADPLTITSDGLCAFQVAVLEANKQRLLLQQDIVAIRSSLLLSKLLGVLLRIFLVYYLLPGVKKSTDNRIDSQTHAISQVSKAISESSVTLEVEMDVDAQSGYDDFLSSFKELIASQYIWDVTSASDIDRIKTRSAAGLAVIRQSTTFQLASAAGISSSRPSAYLKNLNGADIYIYPGFFVMFVTPSELGIVELSDLSVNFSRIQFIEMDVLPSDSVCVGEVWERSNKDGSRDKRYADNKLLPVMEYGELEFRSVSGVYEKYMISNATAASRFVDALKNFTAVISG